MPRCLLPLLAACVSRFGTPDDTALIRCEQPSDCPDGWLCEDGQCFISNDADRQAPQLLSFAVTPALGRAGTTFTLTFEASEALGEEAVVLYGDTPLVHTAEGWSYTATGNEPPGAQDLRVQLTDVSRNRAEVLLPRVFELDFGAPALAADASGLALLGDDPRLTLSQAGPGTLIRISFVVTEPLAHTPTITSEPTGLAFELVSAAGTSYVYAAHYEGAPNDGPVALGVTLIDRAGNTALVPFAQALTVDATPPSAPAGVLLTRAPWGDIDGSAPRFTLSGTASEAGTLVASAGFELARASVNAGAFADVALPGDRTTLQVTLIDAAGNASAPVEVHDFEWVATLGGKTPGNSVSNPHELHEWPIADETLVPPRRLVPSSYAALQANDGQRLTTPTEGGRWENITPIAGVTPSGRYYHTLTYDAARDCSVLFSGQSHSAVALDDLWELNGSVWTRRCDGVPLTDTCTLPAARQGAASTYADAGTLIFGGFVQNSTDELYQWDGTDWRLLCGGASACTGPTGVAEATLTYDPTRQRTVLIGGRASVTMPSDIWEWDGAAWEQMCTDCVPTLRNARSVYDAVRGAVVVAFGVPSLVTSQATDGVWSWNGETWSQLCGTGHPTCTNSPPQQTRNGGMLSFDESRGVLTWLGNNEVWELTDTAWVQRCLGGGTCSHRSVMDGRAVYDKQLAATVVFGGSLNETSVYDGDTWVPRCGGSVSCTNIQAAAGMGVVAASGTVFAMGGLSNSASYLFNQVSYTLVCDASISSCLPALGGRGGAITNRNGEIIHWGGLSAPNSYSDALFRWTGAQWQLLSSATGPTKHEGAAMAYDPRDGRSILFGGFTTTAPCPAESIDCHFDTTWALTGSTWTLLCGKGTTCVGPPADDHPSMAFDPTRQALVLQTDHETWEWNDNSWTRTCETGCPVRAQLSYDPERARIVGITQEGEGWDYDGQWSKRCAVTRGCRVPSTRGYTGLAYNAGMKKHLRIGGQHLNTALPINETWAYDAGAGTRPAHTFTVNFSAAEATGTIVAINAEWIAGGAGGAQLRAWNAGHWQTIASHTTATPSALQAAVPLGSIIGEQQLVYVQVRPNDAAGVTDTAITSDAVALRVRYRTP